MKQQNGFTLVELAIVLMIIGLLIGGILKGQELIQNARITMAGAQIKSYSAGVVTFQDAYGALPGDIVSPATRIPNCTTSPCTIVGNGNGMVGSSGTWQNDENNNFWLHMAKANVISGIDSNATWTSADYTGAAAPLPSFMSTRSFVVYLLTNHWGAPIEQQSAGHYLHTLSGIPYKDIIRYDTKFDDGKPNTGNIILYYSAARGTGGTYDPNDNSMQYLITRIEF